jgi:precorrin-2/cobalt-factor-2 C20-methyltransferase
MTTPTLYIIGTGPGDPDLLTRKAYKTLQDCQILVAPKSSKNSMSTALSIVNQAVDLSGKEVVEVHFPMKKIHLDRDINNEVLSAWVDTSQKILELLDTKGDVAFPTLGDPGIYSTGYYLYDTICSLRPEVNVKFIAGIPAMSSCSAVTATPVCLGDDQLAVIPATFSESKIRQTLLDFDAIILMKVHKTMDRICKILQETGLTHRAVYVEKAGMKDERIIRDLTVSPDNPHYFSTIIIRKREVRPASAFIDTRN